MHLFLLVILRFSLLMLWSLQSTVQTRYSIAVASVSLLESLAFAVLSRFEHMRAIRPSSLINIYLVFSIGLDFVRIRTCEYPRASLTGSSWWTDILKPSLKSENYSGHNEFRHLNYCHVSRCSCRQSKPAVSGSEQQGCLFFVSGYISTATRNEWCS